jgi:DNA-binding MarR family transcriptional regulator
MAPTTHPSTGSRTRRELTGEPDRSAQVVARELMDLLARLRRTARRLVRRDWPYRPLLDSELELLRFVAEHPACRVRDAARALGVAENTISTLVGRLVDGNLVERRRDERDGRAAALVLSPAANRRIAAWRDRRGEVVAEALASLQPADRRAIEAAIPSIARLLSALEER